MSVWHGVALERATREAVALWMTVGYVAHSWGLHGPDVVALAGMPLPASRRLTLNETAAQQGVPVADIVARVTAAVAQLTAQMDPSRD